jgi:hypothetical protein
MRVHHLRVHLCALTLAGAAILAPAAWSASLVASPDVAGGRTDAIVPVTLSANEDEQVAAVQFDVTFDAAALELPEKSGVTPGAAADAAGKQVSFAAIAPGTVRVIVAGFNQEYMKPGDLALLHFKSRGNTAESWRIGFENLLLSDPKGHRVPVVFAAADGAGSPPVAAPDPVPRSAKTQNVVVIGALILVVVILLGAAKVLTHRGPTRHEPGLSKGRP